MFEDWLCGYSEIVGENRKILTFQERCKRLIKLSFNTIREFIIPGDMHFADLFNPVPTSYNDEQQNTKHHVRLLKPLRCLLFLITYYHIIIK